jgi:prepilin-type N-terminal cleavage/methylation domain-containing protein
MQLRRRSRCRFARGCHGRFARAYSRHWRDASAGRRAPRGGFSLLEMMVVVVVIGVLVVVAAPSYQRAMDQSRTNIAAANLRAIWAAQRIYWLEYQVYTDKSTLESAGILDPKIESDPTFEYSIVTSSDSSGAHFQAKAYPNANHPTWQGYYLLDETGSFDGNSGIQPPSCSQPVIPLDFL